MTRRALDACAARHRFELSAEGTGTRLRHTEAFSGVLVRALRSSLDGPTLAGFHAMNAALAQRVLTMA